MVDTDDHDLVRVVAKSVQHSELAKGMPNVQFSTPTTADFGPAITEDPIPLTPQEAAGLPQTLLVGHEPDGPATAATAAEAVPSAA